MSFTPKHMQRYWYFTSTLRIDDTINGDTQDDKDRIEAGNAFETDQKTMTARNKIKKYLKQI